jgi:iron(III) transport system substrate-binding protein
VTKPMWIFLLALGGVAAAAWWRLHLPNETQRVVVYVSHDEVFSEPILKDFERETGIRVRAVYDTEETKSTGAMNRLIVEKNNPQARENK